jgi:hypothetical protein
MGIAPGSYSLNGGPWTEGIILEKTTNHYGDNKEYTVWNVFYHERERSLENSHNTESDALIDILNRFKRYKH